MRLVIDIPEKLWERVNRVPETYLIKPEKIIKHGTPLPKGHGRLIDADAIDLRWSDPEVRETLDEAPTIIEADKGEQEGNKHQDIS